MLVTGGTGGLGALLARHLVVEHGVRHLLLTSRRGPAAPGAAELQAELAGLGADVSVAACDVSDRDAIAALLAAVPARHPLTAVIHAAGAADNGLIGSLTPGALETALAGKADGAWHLHELTRGMDLAFVLVSSAGGMVLAGGQGGYAAANAFLDSLAVHRRSMGLPATSMAFGMWAGTGMARDLADADLARLRRQGVPALSAVEGLAAFDAALGIEAAVVAPLRVDTSALSARTDEIPALLRGLVRAATRQAAHTGDADALTRRLAGLRPDQRDRALLELVRTHAAAVLGHDRPESVDTDRGFLDIGFDSLSALELRGRLASATGLRLPPMLLFDYPTAIALAAHLGAELFGAEPGDCGDAESGDIGDDLSSATAAELFEILDTVL